MTNLIKARSAQYVLEAEFSFAIDDTMVNTGGVSDNFKNVGSHVFEAIPLPTNAVVIGGEVVTESGVTGSTAYDVSVGDAADPTRYLNAADRVAAGRSALVPTGHVCVGGENVVLTIAPTVAAATAGKLTVRVQYVVKGRSNEICVA